MQDSVGKPGERWDKHEPPTIEHIDLEGVRLVVSLLEAYLAIGAGGDDHALQPAIADAVLGLIYPFARIEVFE